jgi:uncharacterized metal-binding protein YceD (DUF177 family)
MSARSVPATPEFARPVDIQRLPPGETVYDIAATETERAALARRFDLLALDWLEAEVRLSPLAGGLLRLAAALSADVVQACVATLEPVAARLEERFTLLYAPAAAYRREEVMRAEAELVEPLPHGQLDIGEAVAQQLSLALDPYPRASGAISESLKDEPFLPLSALAKFREKG